MSSNSHKLTPRQVKCISVLATGATVAEAAFTAGVSEKTVVRWRGNEVFRAALRWQVAAVLQASSLRLVGMSQIALDTLEDVLTGRVNSTTRRLAALAVLEMCLKYFEAVDLEERLSALEARVYGAS